MYNILEHLSQNFNSQSLLSLRNSIISSFLCMTCLPVCPSMWMRNNPFCRAWIKMTKMSFSWRMEELLVGVYWSRPVLVTDRKSPVNTASHITCEKYSKVPCKHSLLYLHVIQWKSPSKHSLLYLHVIQWKSPSKHSLLYLHVIQWKSPFKTQPLVFTCNTVKVFL